MPCLNVETHRFLAVLKLILKKYCVAAVSLRIEEIQVTSHWEDDGYLLLL
jgi:hypothetical protein